MNIFKVFFVYLLHKSLKLRKVSPQAIVTKLFDPPLMPPSLYRSAVLPLIQHSLLSVTSKWRAPQSLLAETEGASRMPTKAMEFSPQVTQIFNIVGFLEIFRSFYGIFRGETEDF